MRREDPLRKEIESLYGRDFAAFVRVCRAIVGDRERAVESVHDGFADAIRGLSGFRGDGSLEAWVWRAVVNAARKARRRPLVETFVLEPQADQDLWSPRVLDPLIVALPERQRIALFLRYYADLNYRQIAEAMDVEVGTVSAALAAAHRAVRESLTEVDGHV
jgi:RNA polymerase sigma-70 factor (ECF subfamily)